MNARFRFLPVIKHGYRWPATTGRGLLSERQNLFFDYIPVTQASPLKNEAALIAERIVQRYCLLAAGTNGNQRNPRLS